MGRIFIYAGFALLAAGLIISYAPWLISWFGKLPGDINIEGERGKIFIPITSMILLSLALTIVLNLFIKK